MAGLETGTTAGLFNSPTLSDIKIKQIKNGAVREYYAHKAILAMGSAYFLKMFSGSFKEASDAVIELHEDDPKIFELLLRYLYAGRHDVTAATRAASSQVEGLNTLFELSIMADKYAVRNIEDEIFNYAILCLKAEANDQHEILQKVAEAYCSSVSNSNRYRAKKIVEIALQPPRNLLTSTAFGTIVESQPLFGAEVASALVKTAMTCVSCCTVTIMPKCIGNGEPRLEGHCSNCSRRQSHYRRNYMPPEE